MSENVENLMLEHLKRFQATLERLEGRIEELTIRQTETHTAVLPCVAIRSATPKWRRICRFKWIECAVGSIASSAGSN